jgi:hypothetical protein
MRLTQRVQMKWEVKGKEEKVDEIEEEFSR